MQLPSSLLERIERLIQRVPMRSLQQRWAEMSEAYRSGKAPELDERSALAYVVGRLPATYAASFRAMEIATQRSCPSFQTHLDVGAGPGTATLAAKAIWPEVQSTLIERSSAWLSLGPEIVPGCSWKRADLTSASDLPKADLVTASYLLNELPEKQFEAVLKRLWEACQGWIVLVEPGTPAGFRSVLAARETLCELGAHVVAPCPGRVTCPLLGSDEWCHFGVRLNRPRFQRLTKEAQNSWEDERFSFMVLSRTAEPLPEGRLLHFPQKRGGHVWVDLCSQDGRQKQVVSKKQGALYAASRRLHWGDGFPPLLDEEIS